MVVINNSRRLFVQQHGYGLGNTAYKTIRGDGIRGNFIKNLGKLLFSSGKKVVGFMKPRGMSFVKDTLKVIKHKVKDMLVDKSTRFIHDVFKNIYKMKQTSKEIIKDMADEGKEKIVPAVKDNMKKTLQKSYIDLIHEKGTKRKHQIKKRKLLKIINK